MGISVDAGIYTVTDVCKELYKLKPEIINPDYIVRKIVPFFGTFVDDEKFILVNNEFYEDYNPHACFIDFLSRYYGVDFWIYNIDATGGYTADDVAEKLEIELEERVYE